MGRLLLLFIFLIYVSGMDRDPSLDQLNYPGRHPSDERGDSGSLSDRSTGAVESSSTASPSVASSTSTSAENVGIGSMVDKVSKCKM